MGKFDYYEGRFPYASDVVVSLNQDVDAFIGKHTYGVELIALHSWGSKSSFSVGRFCSIAHTQFFLAGNHPSHFVAQGLFLPKYFSNASVVDEGIVNDFSSNGKIRIGSDVWIGNFSTIMSGVSIGDGAVIAANAHVVRDVLPYSVVGGNPARHIKFRFAEDVVERLMILRWWELDDQVIDTILDRLRRRVTVGAVDDLIGFCQGCNRTKPLTA